MLIMILKWIFQMNLNLIIGLIMKVFINIKKKQDIQNFIKINLGNRGY